MHVQSVDDKGVPKLSLWGPAFNTNGQLCANLALEWQSLFLNPPPSQATHSVPVSDLLDRRTTLQIQFNLMTGLSRELRLSSLSLSHSSQPSNRRNLHRISTIRVRNLITSDCCCELKRNTIAPLSRVAISIRELSFCSVSS